MSHLVAKFGGSSLADADQFQKVLAIVRADARRRYIIPSAPGKRFAADIKVTDMLYGLHAAAANGEDIAPLLAAICERFTQITRALGLTLDLDSQFEQIKAQVLAGAGADYCASRGEYLSGLVLAEALGVPFIDAADVVRFDAAGRLDEPATGRAMAATLLPLQRAVIPGFYGSLPSGAVKTFSRGGSDISGALVAAGTAAKLYENWTDVSGVMKADPRVVADPRPIPTITYRELREMAYMGATVLHEDAIYPACQAGIPIRICNTNDPHSAGTQIVEYAPPCADCDVVTGIAGRKGFSVIHIDKTYMNSERGFGRRVLSVLEEHDVSFEHLPTGIDTLSVVVESAQIQGKRDQILQQIMERTHPDSAQIIDGLASVAVVGRGMVAQPGTAARLFGALADAGINIRMIDQGSSEMNIIVGVNEADLDGAIRAIYAAFSA